jgi:hypothetical protein
MGNEFFLYGGPKQNHVFKAYLSDNPHVPCATVTLYLSVFTMNYIKQLQADKAEA